MKHLSKFSLYIFLIMVCGLAAINMHGQNVSATWGTNASTAWYTAANWTGGAYSGSQGAAASNTNIATFTSGSTGNPIGINCGTASLNLGAVSIDNTRTTALNLTNSSGTAGVLRLYGATVNTVANTVVRNNGTGLFTMQTTNTLGIVLSNTTENIFQIDNTGGITVAGIISELASGNKLTKGGTGTGILQLTGANTYTGLTTVNGGTLQLNRTGGGTIPSTNNVTVTAGTFRVSSNQTLNNLTYTGGTITVDAGVTLTINGTFAVTGTSVTGTGTIAMGAGSILKINQGGWPGNTCTYTYNSTATLEFANTSGSYGVNSTDTWWPAASGPANVNVSGAGGMTLNVSRTIPAGGLMQTSSTTTVASTITLTMNGTFRINQGGWGGNTGTYTYGSAATLVFNNSTGPYGVNSTDTWWPSSGGPYNVTVQGGGGITMNVARTVPTTGTTGTFLLVTGTNAIQGTALTLNGTTQINGGNFQTTPTYGSSSTLIYNTSYTTSNEWTGGASTTVAAGSGVPANVTIQSGTVTLAGGRGVPGNVTVNATTTLALNGTAGDLYLGGNFSMNGTLTNNNRAVFFVLGNAQSISTTGSNVTFDYLLINKSGSTTVTLSNNVVVNNILTLTAGFIDIANFNLTVGATASGSSSSYVKTTGTGRLLQVVNPFSVVFPVGNSAYNPITLSNNGTSDTYGVIAIDGAVPAATVSTACVNRRWAVTESTAGGGNLSVTALYNTGETGSTFTTSSQVYVGLYVPTTWTTATTTVSGANPYSASASGFTQTLPTSGSTVYFAIGNDGISLAAPTIATTVAASSIANTTATSGGQTISGSGITAKGVVYATAAVTTTPTLSNSVLTDGATTTANFTSNLTSLTPQTQYYVRAYVSNSVGTGYASAINFYSLSNPATAQAGSMSAANSASNELTISWSGATWPSSGATKAGYALIYSTGTPTLSSANGAAPAAGTGTLVTITPTSLPTAPALSYVLSGLTAGTAYNFLLVPFTWDGTNAATYNYLTASAPTLAATAVASPAITTTTSISSITSNAAASGGSGITAGGGTVSAKGVVWNTATTPTTANSSTNDGTGTTSFSSSLTSLSAQTLYYVRAYATNQVGTAYGNELTFRTLSSPATVQAGSLSASNSASAQLTVSWSGATFPSSGATQGGYALIYSTSTPALSSANGAAPAAGVGTLVTITPTNLPSAPATSYVLSGLTGGTAYNFLLVPFTWDGTNAATYNYLTTSAPTVSATAVTTASVTTTTASSITTASASSGGSAISAGSGTISAKGVVWNTSTAPTTANSSTSDGTGTSSYSSSLTSLSAQTLYYYRAYATNEVGTSYGSESTFFTLSSEPTAAASSFSATASSSSQIDLSWTAGTFPGSGATANGYIVLRRSDSSDPATTGVTDGIAPGSLSLASGTTLVTTISSGATTSYNNTSLLSSQQYNYMIIPFTWDGSNAGTYNYYLTSAPTANATTAAGLPSISATTSASSITHNSASSGGSTLVAGGSAITAKGVAYNTSSTPTIANSTTNDGSGTSDFSSSLTGLSGETLYYVRSYVTNTAGTSYGNEISFRTLSNPATAQAGSMSASNSASNELTISWSGATWPSSGATQAGYALIYSTGTPTLSSANGAAPTAGTGTLITITPTSLPSAPATSYVLSGLTAGTTYNFLLVPFTYDGTNTSTYNYLTTSAPTTSGTAVTTASVGTFAIGSITNASASSGGSSISAGGGTISAKGVAWNTSTAPTTANSTTNDGTGTTSYSSSLTSLSAQTLYYVRAYVTNEIGTVYGTERTFRTHSNPATAQASSLNATASASGELTLNWTGATFPSSGATQGGYALLYSTSTPTLTSANGSAPTAGVGTLITITPSNLPATPATTYVLSGLTGGSTYNFLLVPFTWDGTNASTYNYLTTSAPTQTATAVSTASVTTTAASVITSSSASSGGSAVNAGGGTVSAKGVVWNTSTAPTTANSSTNDGTGTSSYSSSLTSLSAQTLYYYRAYVTNDLGTVYGSESSFYTLSNVPTAQASSLTASASSSSNINLSWSAATFPSSGATATGYVLLRATSPNTPSLGNSNGAAPTAGTNTTIVSSSLSGTSTSNSGLTAGTTYNYVLVPFTWDGSNAATYNYLTTSAPTASATTLAAAPSAQPTALVFSSVTSSGMTTSWTAATGSPAGYIVLRSTGVYPDTDPVATTSYTAGNTLGNATVVYVGSALTTGAQTSLVDGTTYYFEVYSYNGSGSGINYLTTSPLSGTQATSSISAPVAAAATSLGSTSFTANWAAVSGASSYLLDVSTNSCFLNTGTSSTATEGFAAGTTAPSGWTITAGTTYTSAGNFGAASPSLSLNASAQYVLTNQLSGAVASQLSFWIKGQGSTGSSLLVQGTTDGTTWTTIENITTLPTTATTKTYTYASTPALLCGFIQFKFTYTKSAGNLSFDDVAITSATASPSYVTGYNGLSVSGTSASVTGLSNATTYYYRVRAVGSASTSINSNVISAATLNDPATADYRSVATGNYGTASTWEYNSVGSTWAAATQAPTSGSNVTIQAGHTVTLDANKSIDSGKTLTITGTLDAGANNISGAGIVAMGGASTIITSSATGLAGALQVSAPTTCTFAAGAKFQFSGTAVNTGFASFTGISAFTFYNIAWTGTTSLTLDKSVRVTTLDFTNSGLIYLGNFDMSMSFSGVINGSPFSSTKMIVTDGTGNLIRFVSAGTGIPFTWPIGEVTGTAEYSPVTIPTITGNAATTAYIGFKVTDAAEPNNGLASNYISRYWTYVTANQTAGTTWTGATFTYTSSDVVGTEALLKANAFSSTTSAWTEFSTSSAASNVLTFTSGASTTSITTGNTITARVDPPLYYRSAASGAWGTASTWIVSTDASFVSPAGQAATSTPTAANSIGITIMSGHSVTSSASVSADQLTIQSGGSLEMTNNALTVSDGTGTDVTVNSGGTLLLSTTSTITINTGATMQIDGLYKVSSTSAPVVTNAGTTTVSSTGTYEHARDAGIIPTCTWSSGSTCLITGVGNNAPTGLAQSFHHFTVNTTLTNSVNCSGALQTINGKFKLTTNNASFGWRLTGTTNYTLTVADSLIISNGILDAASGGSTVTINANGPIVMNGANSQITKSGAATFVFNSNSNFTQNAGIIEFNAGGSSNTTWNIKGDFVQGGTIQRTNGGTHVLNFNKASGVQTWTQTGTYGTGAMTINVGSSTTNTLQLLSNISLGSSAQVFNVTNGATLNMGPYVMTGTSSTFALGATGAVKLGSVDGIVTAPTASGNVQTSVRTFPATASYFYNGTSNQVTGNALPTTLTSTGNLNIQSGTGITVTLSATRTTPTLNLISGLFAAGSGQQLNISANGTVNATGGDFATGATAGVLNFVTGGTGTFTGSCNPYNVYASGGVNFGTGTVTIANGGTFRINTGGFVSTNAPYYASGSTLQYYTTATYGRDLEWSESSGRGYPHHVQISNNTIVNPANTGATKANVPLRTAGNFTIDSGSALYMDFSSNNMIEDLVIGGNFIHTGSISASGTSGSDIYIGGNWQNDGTSANFFPNNRGVFLNGSGTQTISGTNASYPTIPYLLIDKTSGSVSLSRDVEVTNQLTFTAANTAVINAGSYTMYVSGSATTAIDRQGAGHVVGNLRRAVATGTNTYAYPVGDATNYTPVSTALNNVTVAGSITAKSNAGDHPQIASSGIDANKSVNRYYTLTNTGATLTSFDGTFTFVSGDVDAGANTANFLVGDYASGWTYPTIGTRTSTTTQATGINTFGDFAIAECKAPTAYTVTGGGSYCSGSGGVAVGLSGSESGVAYQLKLDGVDIGSNVVGTGSAISFGTQTSGGVYTAVASSLASSGCSNSMTGSVTVVVNAVVNPTVSISTTTTTICSGTSVTFTATAQFGGSSPAYQWKVNSSNVGTNSATYTSSSLANGDVVTCVLTSSETCPSPATVTSNEYTMSVLAYQTPSVTIAAAPSSTACEGDLITFTATPTYGGGTPAYAWLLNGASVGSNSESYSTINLANGNQVQCVMTSDYLCVTASTDSSNALTMTVVTPPQVEAGSNMTTCGTTPFTFANGASNSNTTSIAWAENGAGSITAGANTLTPTYTPAAGDLGTTVTFTLTGYGTSPCAEIADNVTLQVDALTLYYTDADGDGYGNPLSSPVAACSPPTGKVANNTDCCDSNADINPMTEWWADADGDGVGSFIYETGCVSGCSGYASTIAYYPGAHGGAPYAIDCNDESSTTRPGGTELCANLVDDDCDGTIDEGCSGIANDGFAFAASVNVNSTSAYYPGCVINNGSLLNADISAEGNPANVASSAGRDSWYRFVSPSTAAQIKVVPNGFNAVVELRTAAHPSGQVDVENANSAAGGTEIMNVSGLTIGQTYYIAVRNYDATSGGTFTICVSPLMQSGCASTQPAGGFSLCNSFKAVYRGASSYTFNFTGAGGTAPMPYATTNLVSSTGLITLSNASLALRNGGVYNVRVDANYTLLNGAGVADPTITILGPTTGCLNRTIIAAPQYEVLTSQRCGVATLFRATYLTGAPVSGQGNACGAIAYNYRFTRVTNCTGTTTIGTSFVVTSPAATPYLSLYNAFPNGIYPLPNVGYWKVEIAPVYSYGATAYGPAQVIKVNNTSLSTMLPEVAQASERSEEVVEEAMLYPNPGNGEYVMLSLSADADFRGLRVFDQLGRSITEFEVFMIDNRHIQIRPYAPLASGIYHIQWQSGTDTQSHRWIVSH